jgi:hypothetical protein
MRFEEKLLEELKGVVAQQATEEEATEAEPSRPSPLRRRAPRLAFAAAAVVAIAVAVVIVSSGGGGTSAAFAVEPLDNGGVRIPVYSAEDASGLEAALAEAGIASQVTWLPAGMECREPHFTLSSARTALGGKLGGMSMGGPAPAMTIGVMTADQLRELRQERASGAIDGEEMFAETGNITIDPTQLRPDQSVVISGAPGPSPSVEALTEGSSGPVEIEPEGGYEAHFDIAEGPVEPCEPVPVPKGKGMLEQTNQVIEAEAAGR